MKNISSSLLEYYASGQTELAYGILLERFGPADTNFQLYPDFTRPSYELHGFTSHDKSLKLDLRPWAIYPQVGTDYDGTLTFNSVQGFEVSSIVTTEGFAVDNLEITTLDDGSFFNREDIAAKKWSNTFFRIFRYRTDIENPTITEDVEVLMTGWFGEFKLTDTTITIELRGFTEAFQKPRGEVSTKTCRNQFGDGSCAYGDTSQFYTITEVVSNKKFKCATLPYTTKLFYNSYLKFYTGQNKGLSYSATADADGYLNLNVPTILPIQVGDIIYMNEGCDKTLQTCKNRYNNVRNFRGEPHRPTTDALTKN